MTSSTTPGRPEPGHEPDPVRQLVRLFLTQLAAVIAVATIIAVVFTMAGRGTGRVDDTGAAASGSSSPSATPRAASSQPQSTTAPPSTPATSSTPPASSTAAGPEVVDVDVLNQSAGNGSAERVSVDLRKAGWTIGRVADFRGNVRTTTVYWLTPETRRQARQVARFLGGVRVQEGFDSLVDGRVSVILVEQR